MVDPSRHASDMTTHPDAAEMRHRYAMLEGPRLGTRIEGLVVLTGLYAAISPWVVHFSNSSRELTVNNLVLGLSMAAVGLGLALIPERMEGLAWTAVPMGVWMIISPWVVTFGHTATRGMIWNNVAIGAVACVLGLAAGGVTLAMRPRNTRGT